MKSKTLIEVAVPHIQPREKKEIMLYVTSKSRRFASWTAERMAKHVERTFGIPATDFVGDVDFDADDDGMTFTVPLSKLPRNQLQLGTQALEIHNEPEQYQVLGNL